MSCFIYNTSKLSRAGVLCCLSFVPHDANDLISFMVAAVSYGNDYLNNGPVQKVYWMSRRFLIGKKCDDFDAEVG